ncbi:hypothetical protein ACHHYP_00135 [Achlya hypogyna]|uniref:NodB homology domain-containing protein n=1 Tax=Achlya hypogyna TaxID=1202772 RepID=A0A1V9ZBC0_ACHHY|nr:hypothetical protein ACHHYP_00135 [Achlya hypogyna]
MVAADTPPAIMESPVDRSSALVIVAAAATAIAVTTAKSGNSTTVTSPEETTTAKPAAIVIPVMTPAATTAVVIKAKIPHNIKMPPAPPATDIPTKPTCPSSRKVEPGDTVFMTIDDGPSIRGRKNLLTVLQQINQTISFFESSYNFCGSETFYEQQQRCQEPSPYAEITDLFAYTIKAGHFLAAHSNTHYYSNASALCEYAKMAQFTKIDPQYESCGNTPVADMVRGALRIQTALNNESLWDNDQEYALYQQAMSDIWTYARLPCTSAWRLPGYSKTTLLGHKDAMEPEAGTRNAVADAMFKGDLPCRNETFQNKPWSTIGWDTEWVLDLKTNTLPPKCSMFQRIEASFGNGHDPQRKQEVVVLGHDYHYDTMEKAKMYRDMLVELKLHGYALDTVNHLKIYNKYCRCAMAETPMAIMESPVQHDYPSRRKRTILIGVGALVIVAAAAVAIAVVTTKSHSSTSSDISVTNIPAAVVTPGSTSGNSMQLGLKAKGPHNIKMPPAPPATDIPTKPTCPSTRKVQPGDTVFMTIDDGPSIRGRKNLLTALQQINQTISFFESSYNFCGSETFYEQELRCQEPSPYAEITDLFAYTIKAGHFLAAHSDTHYYDNVTELCEYAKMAQFTKIDPQYESCGNTPVADMVRGALRIQTALNNASLWDNDQEFSMYQQAMTSIWTYARLPCTSAWRLPGYSKTTLLGNKDALQPEAGARNDVADAMWKGNLPCRNETFQNKPWSTIGWDVEWRWESLTDMQASKCAMFKTIEGNFAWSGRDQQRKQEVIVLGHDYHYDTTAKASMYRDLLVELKLHGYALDTVNHLKIYL